MKKYLGKLKKLGIILTIGIQNPKKIYKAFRTLIFFGPGEVISKIKSDELYILRTQDIRAIYYVIYKDWLRLNSPSKKYYDKQRKESRSFRYQPKISIITPTYDTNEAYLKQCIDSVINQTYPNWEICIADDASTNPNVRKIIKRYAQKDKRIKFVFRESNGKIARASNSALKLATGEFIGLLDHDDVLLPNALHEVISFLNSNPEADFIYTDEDKIDKKSKERSDPFFKPDWSPDLLYSFMYTGHFTVYRRKLVEQVGNFDPNLTYSQDYDLAFKISEKTKNIFHIGKILYSWRIHEGSQTGGGKPYARKSNLKALANHMRRRGLKGKVVEYPFANKFDYEIDKKKKVSIIIPSDSYESSLSIIKALIKKTAYQNYEIILVINRQVGDQVKRVVKDNRLKIVYFDKEFNFSAKCNLGAKKSSGEFLVFLNDDMGIISGNWIEGLVEFFQRKEVGAVSPKLLYENSTIQHAGMVTGVRGLVGTAFHKRLADSFEYFNLIQSTRDCSILSAACLAIPKKIFERVDGFDEQNTPISHSDIDLSFKIRDLGYLLVYTPFVILRHYGHRSIGAVTDKEKKKISYLPDLFLLNRWGEKISYDPYYPPAMRDFLYGHGFREFKIIYSSKPAGEALGKNLLFVGHESSLTGAPLLLFWLAKTLVRKGYYIVFYLPADGPIVQVLQKFGFNSIVDSEIITNIRDETKQFIRNFDLVLCNTVHNWRTVLASKESGVPTVFYIHESQYGIGKIRTSSIISNTVSSRNSIGVYKAFGLADKVIFPSVLAQEKYQKFLNLATGVVVFPGVEAGQYSKEDGGESRPFTILNVGSIEKRKGQDLMMKAFLLLDEQIRDKMELIFIGRVLNKKYHQNLLEESKSYRNIKFIGEISHDETIEFYKKSDLFVCSSRDETGPLTIIEAISNFVPVVTTKVGLVPELFTNLKDALIVENNSPKLLSEAIKLMYEDRELREKIKTNAHEIFLQKLTLEKYSSRCEEVFSQVMGS